MHLSKQGLDLICRYESFSPIIYLCPAGYPTVGYGHLVTEKNKEQFLDGIDLDEALELLSKDVQAAERAVARFISAPLTQSQFDALVSFTFNLGAGALQRSTLRRKINRGDVDGIPAEFLKWVWAGGHKQKGLARRRAAEANLYLSQ
ncbi:MAG: lysozyme [Alphaproteobacteria bacterium]|nr:lysozyme [Alphaproteobacteria bacterium]